MIQVNCIKQRKLIQLATFKQYIKKNGEKAWMFKTYLGTDIQTGKRIQTTRRGFKSKKEAKIVLDRVQNEFNNAVEKDKTKKTFEEIYKLWLEMYSDTVKRSTLHQTERLFELHILPAFGDKYIDTVTPMNIQEQINKWKKYYVKTNALLNYTGAVFNYALRMQVISINPVLSVELPKHSSDSIEIDSETDFNFYTKEELKEFLSVLEKTPNHRAYVYFRLLAFTGMRRGESLALTWKDVDFKKKTLKISKSITRDENGEYLSTPKNKGSNRIISLDMKTLDILKNFYSGESKNNFIFQRENGNFLSLNKPRKWLVAAQDVVDKERKKKNPKALQFKRITVHGFRHTHASLLFEASNKITIKDVQVRLGHSDIQTTMNVYTHVTPDAKEKLGEEFEKYIDF